MNLLYLYNPNMCGILCIIQYHRSVNIDSDIKCLDILGPRGPDSSGYTTYFATYASVFLGFRRLAIMDTTDAGMQPFFSDDAAVICNGEIYNYRDLSSKFNIELKSGSDCEVIIPVYNRVGFNKMVTSELDAEFAVILLDKKTNFIYVARDRYGVRPLFVGYNTKSGTIAFSSELKAIHSIMEQVTPLSPDTIINFNLNRPFDQKMSMVSTSRYLTTYNLSFRKNNASLHNTTRLVLTQAVKKRLIADRPIGFLLSGGLDSSLIVAIAARLIDPKSIVTFTIGIEGSPDVEAAKRVVKFLGIEARHHVVPFTIDEGINSIPEVIKTIESYDITTIRASVPQYLIAKYIANNTDIKVILSGEGSDEIHGSYRYFRDAPSPIQFKEESDRLLKELYMFDNLRTDRTMAGNGLEVRVPFLDLKYVELIKTIDPILLMHDKDIIEKRILRDSFEGYLPFDILYRKKEAFSDAVSSSETNWYKSIQKNADRLISDKQLETNDYVINRPETKEALYFRNIFRDVYPNRDNVIPGYWLPRFQKKYITDPSATVLECY